MSFMIIIKSSPEDRHKIGEALRLSAAMVGMDAVLFMVFLDQGIKCLNRGAFEDASIVEYLQTAADIAGVYYLMEHNIESESLDLSLDPIPLNIQELAEKVLKCKTVVTY